MPRDGEYLSYLIWLISGRANKRSARSLPRLAGRQSIRVRRSRSLCRLRSPSIAELASITRQRGTSTVARRAMPQVPSTAASPAQSCRRRPLQLRERTSEAVVARFLAVCCPALDDCSQVFSPTHSPPIIPYPHPGLTLATAFTHSAAVRCHRPALPLSCLHARSYRPSGTAPAANHLSGTHARDRRHRYIHPARTQPLHLITLHREQPAHTNLKAEYIHWATHIGALAPTDFPSLLDLPARPYVQIAAKLCCGLWS
jgi:hypothetical protein